ncbi:serine/threonine protein kinase [Catenulispora acidiphila DSM 44928]|uniref:non-specific serine/threonine protein kinase n=2 Tax=Catenulispora TaxID=414878 RepID=C7PXU3_CATAD|nr:serine/threonine protein kinase [Catenulispora acidiphila DSM 44928]
MLRESRAGTSVAMRYVLGRLLGEGATACVYAATDTTLEREVAVKVFRDPDVGQAQAARFPEEIRILTSLVHPHLLPLYDAGQDGDGRLFMAMPLVSGTTLARAIARGPLAPREVKRIGKALADALSHVHVRGIVHRDVKPSNVLLDDDGTPYLADFGFAHAHDGPVLTASDCVVGTAGYLAPEQAAGFAVPPVADVYALGLVLLEALTGERTYRGTPLERAAANALRPPTIPARLGPGWLKVLRAMTAQDPAIRATAGEAKTLLDLGEDELPEVTVSDATMEVAPVIPKSADAPLPPAPDEASAAVKRPASQRRRVRVGAVALTACAVLGFGAGAKVLAHGSEATPTQAPTGSGAGAATPRQIAVTAPPTASTSGHSPVEMPMTVLASAPISDPATPAKRPDAAVVPSHPQQQQQPAAADRQKATPPAKCPPGHKGNGHDKHKC